MINHIVIVLDNCSPSYCHYEVNAPSHLISLDDLRRGILYAMKENLSVQFILPDYPLSDEYWKTMNEIDSIIYTSSTCKDKFAIDNSDVIILNGWSQIDTNDFSNKKIYVIRTSREDLYKNVEKLKEVITSIDRLNIVITNPDGFCETEISQYEQALDRLSEMIYQEYIDRHSIQVNIITDRIMLDKMNNCNAGNENITLMPNGKFYPCPAFYYSGMKEIGSLDKGLEIVNPQLYKIENAPICSICDAYQCKRCIWLNQLLTHERNTPSKEQCLMAHVERKVASKLLKRIRLQGEFMPEVTIPELNYMDPFIKITNPYEQN